MQHLPNLPHLCTHTTLWSFSLIKKKNRNPIDVGPLCLSIACLPWSVADDAPPLLARGGTLWPLSPSLWGDFVGVNLCASCTGCSHLWLHIAPVLLRLKNNISLKPCLSFLAAVRDPWASRGKGVIKTSQPGLTAPKSLPSACCLRVVWVSVWLYPLRQGASLLRVERCIDLHGIPGYLQMKIDKCRGGISPAPPLSKLFIYSRKSRRLMSLGTFLEVVYACGVLSFTHGYWIGFLVLVFLNQVFDRETHG